MKRGAFVATLAASAAIVDAVAPRRALSADDMAAHERNMRLAIEMAKKNPQWPFGAVIVDSHSGTVLGSGVNASATDPRNHGEMVAMSDYIARNGNRDWSKTTLYTTAEPCAMCSTALVWCGIPRIVYASSTPFVMTVMDQPSIRLEAVIASAPFYHNELVLGGILAAETDEMYRNRPKS